MWCFLETATRGVLLKKVLLKISQNSQENRCARVSFLIKLQALGLRPATLLKKRLWHICFPENFVKFLRTIFSQKTSGRLLLFFAHLAKSLFTICYISWPIHFKARVKDKSVVGQFDATGLFRCPLKTSENLCFSDFFEGVSIENNGMKWVKQVVIFIQIIRFFNVFNICC